MSKKNFFSGKEFLTNALFGNNNFKRYDRPIIEDGTLYELPADDVRHMFEQKIIYFCEECNAWHACDEKIEEFNKQVNEK